MTSSQQSSGPSRTPQIPPELLPHLPRAGGGRCRCSLLSHRGKKLREGQPEPRKPNPRGKFAEHAVAAATTLCPHGREAWVSTSITRQQRGKTRARQATGYSWTRPYPGAQRPVPGDAWQGDPALLGLLSAPRPAGNFQLLRATSQCRPLSSFPTSFDLNLPQPRGGGWGGASPWRLPASLCLDAEAGTSGHPAGSRLPGHSELEADWPWDPRAQLWTQRPAGWPEGP